MSYLLGVDNGLTMTKAVVFDAAGRPCGHGVLRSHQDHPRPGWVEKDPDVQWAETCRAIARALGEAGVAADAVAAVALTAHGDGLYTMDARGRAARPAITSLDGRGNEIAARLAADGVADELLPIVGETPFGVQPAVLARWVKEHEPDVYHRIAWVLSCKDWLKHKLTGRVSTDPTDASAGFTDVHTQRYASRAFSLLGLPELVEKLPPIVGSAEVAGEVTRAAALQTGLAPGTPVVSGLHDCDAAALGSGATFPGQLTIIAGTFGVNEVISEQPVIDPGLLCRNWVVPGRWMTMSFSAASAVNLDWYVQQLVPEAAQSAREQGRSPFAFVDDEVAATLDDPSGIIYLPFLYGTPANPDDSAALVGLRGWHRRGHVLRAIYEGTVFNHRTHVDALRAHFTIPEGRLAGGGARSAVWAQMFADGLGIPICVADAVEAGALGAAICAGTGVGIYRSVAEGAERSTRVASRFEPDSRRSKRLDAGYERYQDAVCALRPLLTDEEW